MTEQSSRPRPSAQATYLFALVVGVYATLLGIVHGYFEIQQGAIQPDSTFIVAMGAPCQPQAISHACWPAMTFLPTFQIAGIVTIVLGLLALRWVVLYLGHRWGVRVLAGLALGMLLAGGGFLPPFYAWIAAFAAAESKRPMLANRLSQGVVGLLARLWPWLLILYFAWIGIQLVFVNQLNDFLLSLGGMTLPLEILVLLIAMLSAIAHDAQSRA